MKKVLLATVLSLAVLAVACVAKDKAASSAEQYTPNTTEEMGSYIQQRTEKSREASSNNNNNNFDGTYSPKAYAFPEPARQPGQKSVLNLATAPIKNVRIAVIGLGERGIGTVHRLSFLSENCTIVALCDVREDYVKRASDYLKKKNYPFQPKLYTGAEDWKTICDSNDVDLVYVVTNWRLHTPIALRAMENKKHVASEVPIALTIEDCWKIVDCAERNQVHCMMMENCNYDEFEMLIFNLVKKGMFGNVKFAEGAYIHNLLGLTNNRGYYSDMWRLYESAPLPGCVYPTHGIGPIAHVLDIHRGDVMETLTCTGTAAEGNMLDCNEKFKEGDVENHVKVFMSDMSVTTIRTRNGKTMVVQHDVTSPRPYDRLYKISGTQGFAQKYPNEGIALKSVGGGHDWINAKQKEELFKKYQHPIVEQVGLEAARKVGGHGGMDFRMDYRMIYCLNNGLPLDQDVYDAAEWSSLIELSNKSIELGSYPVKVPDFTRGDWNKIKGTTYYGLDKDGKRIAL